MVVNYFIRLSKRRERYILELNKMLDLLNCEVKSYILCEALLSQLIPVQWIGQ